MWLNSLGRFPSCMHCLSKNHLAACCPQWGIICSPQWAMPPYRPVALLKSMKTVLQTHQDHLIANGSQVLVGYTMHQRGQGVTTTPANLATAAAHVGDLILPPCAACHNRGDETTFSGPGSISSSQRQKILSRTPVHHPSSRRSI